MKPTKAQASILAEMLRTGLPLTYHGGVCKVGERATTVPLRRALLEGKWVRAEDDPDEQLVVVYNTPLVLTDAGREEAQKVTP